MRDVSFSYGEHEVLEKIDLDIHRGDYLGVVGPNGAGKTTLLKIILGLLKPSSGSVKLMGKVGYVPQKATNFDTNFPATAYEVVLMGTYPQRGLFARVTDTDRANARKALEEVDMWEYRNRLIGKLSGGQQQRVFIARALAAEPEIIFLDEPTSGVDQKAQADFYHLLKRLNEKNGLTLVLVSHDIEAAKHDSMHIAHVNKTLTYHYHA